MKKGVKHLIECHCVLPQFRTQTDPVYHRFTVFSDLDDSDAVIPKYAQCTNCGVIHHVFDIARSEIQAGNEENISIVSINDIKLSMPSNIISVLESYNVDLATWEQAQSILENKLWGSFVVLRSDDKSGKVEGKCLRFIGQNNVRIEPYSYSLVFP